MCSHQVETKPGDAFAVMTLLDSDGDGKVSLEEWFTGNSARIQRLQHKHGTGPWASCTIAEAARAVTGLVSELLKKVPSSSETVLDMGVGCRCQEV